MRGEHQDDIGMYCSVPRRVSLHEERAALHAVPRVVERILSRPAFYPTTVWYIVPSTPVILPSPHSYRIGQSAGAGLSGTQMDSVRRRNQ